MLTRKRPCASRVAMRPPDHVTCAPAMAMPCGSVTSALPPFVVTVSVDHAFIRWPPKGGFGPHRHTTYTSVGPSDSNRTVRSPPATLKFPPLAFLGIGIDIVLEEGEERVRPAPGAFRSFAHTWPPTCLTFP